MKLYFTEQTIDTGRKWMLLIVFLRPKISKPVIRYLCFIVAWARSVHSKVPVCLDTALKGTVTKIRVLNFDNLWLW